MKNQQKPNVVYAGAGAGMSFIKNTTPQQPHDDKHHTIMELVVYWETELRKIKDSLDDQDRNSRYYSQIYKHLAMTQATVEALQSLLFTNVNDRLPSINEEVLTLVWDGVCHVRFLAAYTEEGWYHYDTPLEDDIFTVVAWRALGGTSQEFPGDGQACLDGD